MQLPTQVSLKAAEGPPMVRPMGFKLRSCSCSCQPESVSPRQRRLPARTPNPSILCTVPLSTSKSSASSRSFAKSRASSLSMKTTHTRARFRCPGTAPRANRAGSWQQPTRLHLLARSRRRLPQEMTLESADPVVCIAASLAMFVQSQGGSIPGSSMSEYYKIHPEHKQVISDAGLRAFCERYDGLFRFEPLPGSGKLSLKSFCCHYLRGECVHAADHDGKLHSMPASSPVVCSFGTKCIKGHWKRLGDLAKRASALSHCQLPQVRS